MDSSLERGVIQYAYAVKVLSIFVIYGNCHLECHFDTIVAVCNFTCVIHEANNPHSSGAPGCVIGWSNFSR